MNATYKKILYLGPFRFPNHDAASSRVLNNSKVLKALNFDVVVLSWGGTYLDGDLSEDGNYYHNGIRYIITKDIDLRSFFRRLFGLFFTGQNSLRFIRKELVSTRFVIGYNLPLYFTLRMMLLSNYYKVAFISDLSEWYNGEMYPGGKFCFPAIFNRINMTLVQKFVRNKILMSSYLSRYYFKTNNLIIPPLVDINDSKWSLSDDNLEKDMIIRFLYVGTPSSANDIKDNLELMLDNFIPFFESNASIKLNIIGVTIDDITHYKNFNMFKSYESMLTFHGRIPSESVPLFFFTSDFSIIYRSDSRKSNAGFPTKLAESFAASCAVISSNISDINQFVVDGYNGFILNSESPDEFEILIHNIIGMSQDEIKAMKNNSYGTALKKFHFLVYKESFEKYFNNLSKIN
jgi:glycosyltransferase involved in cell wall biosynthesis